MMSFSRTFSLLAATATLAACSSGGSEMETMSPGGMDNDAPRWTANIESLVFDGHGGSATAWIEGSQTVIRTTLNRGAAGGVHPWHIHEGRCGSGGGVVGSGSAYAALRPGTDNDATETARLDAVLSESGQYYVNIHQSSSAMGTIVGCGNLLLQR